MRLSGLRGGDRPKRIAHQVVIKPVKEFKFEGPWKASKRGKRSKDYFAKNRRVAWPMKMDLTSVPVLYTDDSKRKYYAMQPGEDEYNRLWIESLKELHPKDAVFLWVAVGVDGHALELPDATESLTVVATDGSNSKFTGTIIDNSLNKYKKQRKTGYVVLSGLRAVL